ncbi:MAG TPA: PEP-CTERM sorting domain-containing protein [Pirellulales bacterium]|jgi:hypothetical protein|nr:PEP-CTERM sorting domain-containing protein [Pirellulales bacterium]
MRNSLVALLLTALAAVVPLSAAKASVLDQSDIAGMAGVSADGSLAQTFTVGITGTLSSVELKMDLFGNSAECMIATTNAEGVPTNTILGEASYPSGNDAFGGQWIPFNFSPGIPVHVGELLAIEVPSAGISWGADAGATYAGGAEYWYTFSEWGPGGSYDMNFQTFVIPAPEPSSLVLLVGGAAGLLLAARRRKA